MQKISDTLLHIHTSNNMNCIQKHMTACLIKHRYTLTKSMLQHAHFLLGENVSLCLVSLPSAILVQLLTSFFIAALNSNPLLSAVVVCLKEITVFLYHNNSSKGFFWRLIYVVNVLFIASSVRPSVCAFKSVCVCVCIVFSTT